MTPATSFWQQAKFGLIKVPDPTVRSMYACSVNAPLQMIFNSAAFGICWLQPLPAAISRGIR